MPEIPQGRDSTFRLTDLPNTHGHSRRARLREKLAFLKDYVVEL